MIDTPIELLRQNFCQAPFIASLGLELASIGAGECTTRLDVRPDHLQQNGVVHAGVLATLADHTAGAAAFTTLAPGSYPLTVEFKLNLLRPATGPTLRCIARVLKAGARLVVVESEVLADATSPARLCAKATVTLAVLTAGEAG